MLLTANERVIMMWDVVSLTHIGTLKGIKEEVKAMQLVGEKLFAGTKGTPTSGGLLIYDLRKSENPVEEREKKHDIFSLAATETSDHPYLFFGCRNHTVNPFDLKQWITLNPLEPPHFDAVTSLALIGGGTTLISGSKDKNLRLYNLYGDG